MNMKITTTEVQETECVSARVLQVIETKSARGKDEPDSPMRIVRQYWSTDGVLLAEAEDNADSCKDTLTAYKRAKGRAKLLKKHLMSMGITASSEDH